MYVRFESRIRDRSARCNQGVFCSAFDIWYEQPEQRHHWQIQEMRRVLDWFNENLNAPLRMCYRPNRKAEISGVCWFRTTSEPFIAQARYLAWLLSDLGHPMSEMHCRNPGRVIWQDRHQIVATRFL